MTPDQARAQAEAILDGFSDDHRRYQALQLQLNRRFSKGWALYNNVTFSKVEGKTYGGGNGSNDLGAFNALSDDYGRNLDAVLTEAILNGFAAPGANYAANQTASARLAAWARAASTTCAQYIGTPISTINRFGELPIDREIIYKSYGYKQWNFGS